MPRKWGYIVSVILWVCIFSLPALPADLSDMVYRLAKQAEDLSTDSYRGFNTRNRSSNIDVEMLFQIQQFGAGTNLLRRMVEDRRTKSELLSACDLLKTQSRNFSNYSFGRQNTNITEIQQLLDQITQEVEVSVAETLDTRSARSKQQETGSRRDIPETAEQERIRSENRSDSRYSLGTTGPGSMTWSGTVDDEIHVQITRNRVYVQVLGGQDVQNMNYNFSGSLPYQNVTVSVKKRKGRGTVQIFEQPTRANNYQAVVRIYDPKGGSDSYEFELSW